MRSERPNASARKRTFAKTAEPSHAFAHSHTQLYRFASSVSALPLALKLPLTGSGLIEASAGTGKTWTIAALYLRLVLGHGANAAPEETPIPPSIPAEQEMLGLAFARPLIPKEILVVTFTRAATQELVSRIRERLSEAAHFFRQHDDGSAHPDAFLQHLRAHYPPGPLREQAAWRLANAAETMDEAAIHTIDGWCRRVLQNYASLTGVMGDDSLDGDTHALWEAAAMDFWRNHIYPMQGDAMQAIQTIWPDAQKWLATSQTLRSPPQGAPLFPGASGDFGAWLGQAYRQQQQKLQQWAAEWQEKTPRLQAWLNEQVLHHGADWSGSFKPHYPKWLQAIADWAQQPTPHMDALSESAKRRLSPSGMLAARTRNAPALAAQDLPPELEDLQQLLHQLAQLPALRDAATDFAARYTYQRWQQLKAQQALMDFGDLLLRVRQALDGPHGPALRQRLLGDYPVALIDEFQDTSPDQYAVFHTIYQTVSPSAPTPHTDEAAPTPPRAWLLIGDPKQSIYSFRGADIYSFLAAKQATQGQHYALDTNFRSTHAIVAAVNHLFAQAEARCKEGAFRFRTEQHDPLPFTPVQARGLEECLQTSEGAVVPALTFCAPPADAQGDRPLLAQLCAEQIAQWLNQPLRFQSTAQPDAPEAGRTLQPGDIAVLVHRQQDAALMQKALRQRGLDAVYLSDRQSVFDSPESLDLVHWLRAVAEPGDVALARAAFATPLMAQPIADLLHAADHEDALERQLDTLQSLHAIWRRQGVLPMLHQTIHRLNLAQRWHALHDGRAERRMTNLLHLAELLQQASEQHEGMQGLIRHLVQQIHHARHSASDMDAGEQTLRLESDAQLIQIVTIHKSKGLEYPVVLLPFATHARANRGQGPTPVPPAPHPPAEPSPPAPDPAEERLREDLRLLYVALTRARHALWVGAPRHKLDARSALAHLIDSRSLRPKERGESDWFTPLSALAQTCPHIHVTPTQDAPCTPYQRPQPAPHWRPLLPYPQGIEQDFAIVSFSALVRGAQPAPALAQPAAHTVDADADANADEAALHHATPLKLWQPLDQLASDEPVQEASALPTPTHDAAHDAPPANAPWHALAGSARLGDWVHQSLEWLQAEGFPTPLTPAQQHRLARTATLAGFDADITTLETWLTHMLDAALPLPDGNARLCQLHSTLPELEFWLPVPPGSDAPAHPHAPFNAHTLDALCRHHIYPGQPRPQLPARQWQGMLMGFADLVFQHQGRYWVLDYKTNRLGPDAASYHASALGEAVLQHRYDLQAALYLYALHRLLHARLPDYHPQRHLGGALYWFLRGIDHPQAGLLHIATAPDMLQAMDEALGAAPIDAPKITNQ